MHMEVASQFNHPGGQVGATVVAGLAVEEAKKWRKEKDIEVDIIHWFFQHKHFKINQYGAQIYGLISMLWFGGQVRASVANGLVVGEAKKWRKEKKKKKT